jgi:cytochrome c5
VSKADDVFYRQFGIVLLALVLFTVIVFFTARTIGSNTFERMQSSPHAVQQRIEPIGQARVGEPAEVVAAAPAATAAAPAPEPASAATTAASAGEAGESVYKKACIVCHAAGVAGAPKFGDKGAWEPRLAQGIEALYGSALKGKGAMPAKGGNMSLSDDDVKSAVRYMLGEAGLQPG